MQPNREIRQGVTKDSKPSRKVTIFAFLHYLVMSDVKSLVKTVTRCNRKELSQSRSIERKYKRHIGRCQANFTKMGYIIEATSKEIKEEQAEIARARMEEE